MINTKTIRDGIVSRLTGQTTAGSNVNSSRALPYKVTNLPAISVFTSSMNAESISVVTPAFKRTVDIGIEVIAAANTDWQDVVDDILFTSKTILFTDATWTGQFQSIAGYTEEHDLDDSGEKPIAIGTLTISVEIVEPEIFN